MKLEISDKLVEEIRQHGVAAYPNECCGALLRVAGEDGVKSLWALLPLDNRREGEAARTIVAHCRSGVRSADAVNFLRKAGFRKVWNLKGCCHRNEAAGNSPCFNVLARGGTEAPAYRKASRARYTPSRWTKSWRGKSRN